MKISTPKNPIDFTQIDSLWNAFSIKEKYPIIAEINCSALTNNAKNIKTLLKPTTKMMAVVKANAYGHGAIEISKALSGMVDYFGVSRISEAVDLRKHKITTPILTFGVSHSRFTELLCAADITQSIHSIEMAKAFSEEAIKIGKKLKVHIKIDTGLGRFGLFLHKLKTKEHSISRTEKVIEEIKQIVKLKGLNIEGIYTHAAATNLKNIGGLRQQIKIFESLVTRLKQDNISFKLVHAIGSFGLFNIPNAQFDMVRLGKSLYGITPITNKDVGFSLEQILKIKTSIASIKNVPKGTRIGYGYNYIIIKESKIATVPFGFADGCIWEPKQTAMNVLVRSQKVPIIGRICMDFLMLDVSALKEVNPGDEVVIVGKMETEEIKLEDIAKQTRTIPTYVSTSLNAKTPKTYTY